MKRVRVLIVDDSLFMRAAIKKILAADPRIEVVGEAKDGAEAVTRAAALRPDVIILDLIMDGIDGFQTAAELSHHPETAQIPILVFTSRETTAEDRRELAGPTTALLTKAPEDRKRMVETIRELEARRRARTARHDRTTHLGD